MENQTEQPHEKAYREFTNVLSTTPEAIGWERYLTEELGRYRPGGTQLYREKRALELLGLTEDRPEQNPDAHIEEGKRLRRELAKIAAAIAPNHNFAPDSPQVRGLAVSYVNQVLTSLEEQEALSHPPTPTPRAG